MRATIIVMSTALMLAACGQTAGAGNVTANSYAAREQALAEDCRLRGGILTPTGAQRSSNPAADNACRITGQASRVPPY